MTGFAIAAHFLRAQNEHWEAVLQQKCTEEEREAGQFTHLKSTSVKWEGIIMMGSGQANRIFGNALLSTMIVF